MKFRLFQFVVFMFLFSSCQETHEPIILPSNLTLNGTFERVIENQSIMLENVTIRFENNTFNGQSNTSRFPAICRGTYEFIENKINFNNECAFTADFDWTLILNGEFELSQEDDQLIMKKVIGSGSLKITDIYTFTIQGDYIF